jgi:hypothetical protein
MTIQFFIWGEFIFLHPFRFVWMDGSFFSSLASHNFKFGLQYPRTENEKQRKWDSISVSGHLFQKHSSFSRQKVYSLVSQGRIQQIKASNEILGEGRTQLRSFVPVWLEIAFKTIEVIIIRIIEIVGVPIQRGSWSCLIISDLLFSDHCTIQAQH